MAPDQVAVAGPADEVEGDEDESEEQPGAARADQTADGERRPRRRGRRGGRRRRGGPEDGLIGSIADELGPTSAPEVADAVADFDGYSAERAPPEVQPEPVAPPPEQTDRSCSACSCGAGAGARIRNGDRPRGRKSRRAPPFDRARKGELPGDRPARGARPRYAQPRLRAAGVSPGAVRRRDDDRHPAAQGRLVVAALRQRRVGQETCDQETCDQETCETENRPAKPGGFLLTRDDRFARS